MDAKKIWRDIKKSADKLGAPGQKPFLILDKAPGHVGKKAWKQVTPAMCKNIRARVLSNMAIVKIDGRNFYDESMTKTMLGL